MEKTAALIMAAGTGDRFSDTERKTFYPLLERPMLVWSVERFARHLRVDSITVLVPPGDEDRVGELLAAHGVTGGARIVPGGPTRQESVRLGLDAVDPSSTTVLVHDAARPCVTVSIIDRVLEALGTHDAVVPVWPVVDTLVREADRRIRAVVDRSGVSCVQTPQGFRTALLVRAHRYALEKGLSSSDDGSLVLALGETVWSVVGERTNIKVTYAEDAQVAEAILASQGA